MKHSMKQIFLTFCLVLTALSLSAEQSDKSLTVVMVHGATAGGWEWKPPAKFLEADGHDVYRVTLTGLGERYHLASAEVDLETHIEDVVNVILFEDLHNVVLTGHSYGGMVVTGVLNRIPERLSHVIYFDAAVPEDGQCIYDLFDGPPSGAKVVDGLVHFGWGDPDGPFPKNVPHPEKCFTQPVSYDNPTAFEVPVTYVAFVPEDQSVDERAKNDKGWKVAESRGWTVRTFTGHHVAQLENPRGIASLIEDAVANDENSK